MAALDFDMDAFMASTIASAASSASADFYEPGPSSLSPPSPPSPSPPSPAPTDASDPLSVDDGPRPPRDLTHLYAETTKLRLPSKMKDAYKFFRIPGIGNLAGGLPNVQFFPYDTLEAKIAKPERWTPTPNAKAGPADPADPADPAGRTASEQLLVPKSAPAGTDPVNKIDLETALQYGNADGYPPLLAWVRQFTREHLHPNVPYKDGPDVILTVGSTDGLNKTLELFVDDWSAARNPVADRPGLLCETFVYGNVLSQIAPKGMAVVPVAADADGMVAYGPGGLEDVLASWDPATGRRPHIMYTVTMGHNPTGIVLGVHRRKQLYDVCSRFDVIIVEDDPYWYLQFPSAAPNEAASRGLAQPKSPIEPASLASLDSLAHPDQHGLHGLRSSGYEYLDSLTPSFLTFDVDGRVVRLDTFSKTVAPGCRLGWITAQPALIERFQRISETGTQQPSGFVQSLISELVMGPHPANEGEASRLAAPKPSLAASLFGRAPPADAPAFAGWRMDGWVRWLEGLRGEYERRMNTMATILDQGAYQLKQGTPVRSDEADWGVITKTRLLSFDWPRGGMFLWLRIHFEAHPLWLAPRTPEVVAAVAAVAASGPDAAAPVLDGPFFALATMILLTSKPYLVLVAPGTTFSATNDILREQGWAYFRLCFAAETDANIKACSERFVAAIHKLWKMKKVEDLEDLLRSAPAAAADAAAAHAAGELGNFGQWLGC